MGNFEIGTNLLLWNYWNRIFKLIIEIIKQPIQQLLSIMIFINWIFHGLAVTKTKETQLQLTAPDEKYNKTCFSRNKRNRAVFELKLHVNGTVYELRIYTKVSELINKNLLSEHCNVPSITVSEKIELKNRSFLFFRLDIFYFTFHLGQSITHRSKCWKFNFQPF